MALADCCEIVSGATPSTAADECWGGDVCWATPKDLSDLDGHYISDTPRKLTQKGLSSCAASVLPPGSVLFSSRAPIGHVAINTVPMATNQGFKSFVPNAAKVDAKFLFHWLRKNRPYLESLGVGATFKEVSKSIVSKIKLPLPPLPEQRRIAAILDQADALRAKRREALAQLDRLAQSIFVEMFGEALQSAARRSLGTLVEEFRYGTSNKSGEDGYPALRIPNVVGGALDLTELKTVSVDANEFSRLRLLDGDLLFVRTNGNQDYVGRSTVFFRNEVATSGFDADSFIYASYLIRARVKPRSVLPAVLQFFLSTEEGRRELRSYSKTSAGQFNINTEGLGALLVPDFPMDLQECFVQRMAVIGHQRSAQKSFGEELDALFASLQHRAFRGEL